MRFCKHHRMNGVAWRFVAIGENGDIASFEASKAHGDVPPTSKSDPQAPRRYANLSTHFRVFDDTSRCQSMEVDYLAANHERCRYLTPNRSDAILIDGYRCWTCHAEVRRTERYTESRRDEPVRSCERSEYEPPSPVIRLNRHATSPEKFRGVAFYIVFQSLEIALLAHYTIVLASPSHKALTIISIACYDVDTVASNDSQLD
jgi:hypothetical protein